MAGHKPLPKAKSTIGDKQWKQFKFGYAKANETRTSDQVINDVCRQNRWRDQ